MRNYLKIKNKQKFVRISVLFLIISFATLFFFVNFKIIINNNNNITQEEKHDNHDNSFTNSIPKASATDGELNLTSGKDINGKDINNTRYYHGSNITIEGKVFNKYTGPLENVNVSLVIDLTLYDNPKYSNQTNANGEFQINFTIPNTLNIHCNHSIGAHVTDTNLEIKYLNHYNIMINTTSYFYKIDPTIPILTGENVLIVGSLRYDNGTSIPNANFNYDWYDNTTYLSGGIKFTTPSGAYPPIQVPYTSKSELILKFNYSAPPDVNYSETSINVMVFPGISCNWNVELEAYEGDQYLIEGQISNSANNTIKINDREVNLFYNKTFLATVKTNENGMFTYSYNIPEGTGSNIIRVELVTNVENKPFSTVSIVIDSVPPSEPAPPEPEPEPVPFQDFFFVFIPIIIGVVAGLSGYGYYYYRKQKQQSLLVNVSLESKIRNLKILKDTGRLEESISYLFNALYMELVNAKYGRVIKETETIRDFAIISVKELKLNPASIYPFIQIIEKVNYFPFNITEKDFYSTVELFSPIYFDLTGFYFNLNF